MSESILNEKLIDAVNYQNGSRNPYHVKAGEILVMPPDIPHGLKAVVKSKMLLTMIK